MGWRLTRGCVWSKTYRRCNPDLSLSPSPSSSPHYPHETREREIKGAKIASWGRCLAKYLRPFSFQSPGSRGSYRRISLEFNLQKQKTPPKGYLPVYVGGEEFEARRRVLVPIIVFNHPLFAELMKKTEEEFGYRYQGGITIPCPSSDFDRVWSLVAAEKARRRRKYRKLA